MLVSWGGKFISSQLDQWWWI